MTNVVWFDDIAAREGLSHRETEYDKKAVIPKGTRLWFNGDVPKGWRALTLADVPEWTKTINEGDVVTLAEKE